MQWLVNLKYNSSKSAEILMVAKVFLIGLQTSGVSQYKNVVLPV